MGTRTNGHELLGHILAGCSDNRGGAARMAFKKLGAVVDLAVHYEPRLVVAIVLPELINHDGVVYPVLGHAYLPRRFHHGWLLSFPRDVLAPEPVRQVAARLLDPLHPSSRDQSGLRWVLETEHVALLVDHDSVPGIVHHAQNAPVHVPRLDHHRVVHGADHQAVDGAELRQRDIDVPKAPAIAGFSPAQVDLSPI